MNEVRIALSEEDFRELVAGRVARPTFASGPGSAGCYMFEIILSDIGWERMRAAIDDAQRGDDA